MVAALKPQPEMSRSWVVLSESERHGVVAIAMWRCFIDNHFWPDLRILAETTGIPPTVLSSDLLMLVHRGFVRMHGSGYKLIVRREV